MFPGIMPNENSSQHLPCSSVGKEAHGFKVYTCAVLSSNWFDLTFFYIVSKEEADRAVSIPHADSSIDRQINNNAFAVRSRNLRAANDIQHLVSLSFPRHNPWCFFNRDDFITAKKGTQWQNRDGKIHEWRKAICDKGFTKLYFFRVDCVLIYGNLGIRH